MTTDPLFPMQGMTAPPASERDLPGSPIERLMRQFEGHEREELDFLKGYQKVVEDVSNPMVRFLLELIMADEEKHHGVVHAMAATIRGQVNWSRSEDAIPDLGEIDAATRQHMLELTRAFIREEKNTIREYKAIMKETKNIYKGMFVLLIQTIILDSEKHVMILEFLEKKLKDA